MSESQRLHETLANSAGTREASAWLKNYQAELEAQVQTARNQQVAASTPRATSGGESMTKSLTAPINVKTALTDTAKSVVGSAQQGAVLAGATQLNKRISSLGRSALSSFIPEGTLNSDLGVKASEFLVPIFLLTAANIAGARLPYADSVKKACELALQGVTFENSTELFDSLAPIFEEVGRLHAVGGDR